MHEDRRPAGGQVMTQRWLIHIHERPYRPTTDANKARPLGRDHEIAATLSVQNSAEKQLYDARYDKFCGSFVSTGDSVVPSDGEAKC